MTHCKDSRVGNKCQTRPLDAQWHGQFKADKKTNAEEKQEAEGEKSSVIIYVFWELRSLCVTGVCKETDIHVVRADTVHSGSRYGVSWCSRQESTPACSQLSTPILLPESNVGNGTVAVQKWMGEMLLIYRRLQSLDHAGWVRRPSV